MSAPVLLPQGMHVFERGWLSSNNILFQNGGRTVLVDTGYATHSGQTLALVRHVLKDRTLDEIINTHLHADHCGGNALLQQVYGCATRIPAGDAEAVRHWDDTALSFRPTGQQCPRFSFDGTLSPGDRLELGGMEWEALGAPGHDPHALLLACPDEGILISGDALWENGFGVIFPELEGESGFAEARHTLDMIGAMSLRLVIPGHGKPFTDVTSALEIARSRLDYLAADPVRNARHAVKVLFKFLLLERRQMKWADAELVMQQTPLFSRIAERHLHQSLPDLLHWTVGQLARANALRVDGGTIVNLD